MGVIVTVGVTVGVIGGVGRPGSNASDVTDGVIVGDGATA